MIHHPLFLCVICCIVVAELVVLIPLGLSLRASGNAETMSRLQSVADATARRVRGALGQFLYGASRTGSAISLLSSYVNDDTLFRIVQPGSDPLISFFTRIFWVDRVSDSNRSSYEDWARAAYNDSAFSIMAYNGTDLVPARTAPFYFVFSSGYPPLDDGYAGLKGFDALSVADFSVAFSNNFPVLYPHITLGQANSNSFGLLLVYPQEDSGWVLYLVDSITLIEAGLTVPRADVQIFAFALTNETRNQLLYREKGFDDIVDLDTFVHSLVYQNSVRTTVVFLNSSFLLALKFSPSYVASAESRTWIIIIASVSLACLVADVLLFFGGLWILQLRAHRLLLETRYDVAARMLGYVNHELRNPLQAIVGIADLTLLEIEQLFGLMDDHSLAARIRSNVSTISRSGLYMRHIINDILDIRRLEEGVVEIVPENVDVKAIFLEVSKTIRPKLEEKPLIRYSADVLLSSKHIVTDPMRLEQILLNLLSNSIKFTDEGSITMSVMVTATRVLFIVKDTGRGIPSSALEHLFLPFHQTKTTDATRYGGTGLGLYLCRMMADLLGATITVSSRIGIGSIFRLEFPLSVIPDEEISLGLESTSFNSDLDLIMCEGVSVELPVQTKKL